MKRIASFALLCLLAIPAVAQEKYSAMLGANFYAEDAKHPAGSATLLVSLDDTNCLYSYTEIEVRGVPNTQPVQATRTGISRCVTKVGPFSIFGLANLGVATSSEATSGDFAAGAGASIVLKHGFDLVLGYKERLAPAAGGWHKQPFIAVRFGG